MAREIGDKKIENKIIKKHPKLSPKFIFLYPAYNVRNNEISAVLGINQLKRLTKSNKIRTRNLKYFLENLDSSYYWTDFELKGSSNYAFPLVLNKQNLKNRNKLENILMKNKIEFRRGNAGGGNQIRQPYIKKIVNKLNLNNFQNVDHVHFYGYYIGNYPSLSLRKIKIICKILNSINYE